jgi:hypothetical protein
VLNAAAGTEFARDFILDFFEHKNTQILCVSILKEPAASLVAKTAFQYAQMVLVCMSAVQRTSARDMLCKYVSMVC